MYSMWLTNDEQHLWRNHLTMSAQLLAAMNRQLQSEHGLSLADYDILVALEETNDCRVNELGDRLGWEQSRLSHQLRRMRERGLVSRHGATDDRRGARVELTRAGSSALAAAAPAHVELVRRLAFEGISKADLHVVERWTATVLSRLGRKPDDPD